MRIPSLIGVLCLFASAAYAQDDWLDKLDDALTFNAFDRNLRIHLSGLADLEGYTFQRPAPGLIDTDKNLLFNPRLTLYLDGQIGPYVYVFAQARVDRGFDPSDHDGQIRADEYAIRVTPWEDGRFSIQLGKFGTVVGNWARRYDSWENPFVTAPLAYENLTPLWDSYAPDSPRTLLDWGHLTRESGTSAAAVYADKYLRIPMIWGPSYSTGIAVSGKIGAFEYAAEMKNAPLSSRPEAWNPADDGFEHPTFSTRFGIRPDPAWNLGFSASAGPYLLPEAGDELPPGHGLNDYRELLLGQDLSFAWHHWQFWAEFYEARFQVPNVGNADMFSYYLEAKYKFTPQLFGALRWNQEVFGTISDGAGGTATWGRDIWRIDAAVGYRFTARTQLKLQYSFQHEDSDPRGFGYTLAAQFTIRF
jgi:hypothetical protein